MILGLPISRRQSQFMLSSIFASSLLVAGCLTNKQNIQSYDVIHKLVEKADSNRINDKFIKAGLLGLEDGKLDEANRSFSKALKFDPANSKIHFLNGLAYHLRAEAGDGSQYDYAKIGYGLALQFDPSDYWAAYLLGRIKFRQQNYRGAQEDFASAVLLAPKHPQILLALAAASYYARDLNTAHTAIDRASHAAPQDPNILHASAIIYAATGKKDKASLQLAAFTRSDGAGAFRKSNLTARVSDWARAHRTPGAVQLAQDGSNILGSDATTEGVGPSTDSSGDGSTHGSAATAGGKIPKMALVDVAIIRSEERVSSIKGVNLLSGLQVAFQYTALNLNATKTQDAVNPANTTNVFTNTKAVSLASPAAINYSLNIFNDNSDYNEVLARPTLTAVDGKASEFFSGAILHVELDGVAGSEGTVQAIPIGVRLKVTPNFLNDTMVRYDVEVARAFIENRAAQSNFNNFTQTSKTEVKGSVVMRFGETLVISGLSEREDEKLKDGVPFLQTLPGIQYLFSQENTSTTKKSVLILVTPREPRYTYADGTPKQSKKAAQKKAAAARPSLSILKNRPDWFKPANNVDTIIGHMKDRTLYNEFRAGDVKMEAWENPLLLSEILRRTISFLYY
jgi:tetratricopeptide (TPR) repeat protein